jgi:hypothetical protein
MKRVLLALLIVCCGLSGMGFVLGQRMRYPTAAAPPAADDYEPTYPHASNIVWRFSFDTGTNASGLIYDDVGTNDATMCGTPDFETVEGTNDCLYFDGSEEYITCPRENVADPGENSWTRSFTISLWAKRETGASTTNLTAAVGLTKSGGSGRSFRTIFRPGFLFFECFDASDSDYYRDIMDNPDNHTNTWVHVCFVHAWQHPNVDACRIMYTNGIEVVDYQSDSGSCQVDDAPANKFFIGVNNPDVANWDRYVRGWHDEVVYYINRALTSNEVYQIYTNGLARYD